MEWESLLEHYRLIEKISETQLEIYRKLEKNQDPETRELTRDMAVPVVVRVDFIKLLHAIPKDGHGWKTFGARGFKSAI